MHSKDSGPALAFNTVAHIARQDAFDGSAYRFLLYRKSVKLISPANRGSSGA